LLKNKIEFILKFEIGREAFTELIRRSITREVESLGNRLVSIQNQIQHQERKFARLQARRQGKILLECEYRQSIGCFGEDWCDNCRVNYPVATEANQLKGGAC
jgi:hypothetical protein